MKVLWLALLLFFSYYSAPAQFYHNMEYGGSNYSGFSITTEYRFHPGGNSPYYISPKLGLGHIFFWKTKLTAQAGLAFGYEINGKNALELNSNASYLLESPLEKTESNYYNFPDNRSILWLNGVDWKIQTHKICYTIGGGILMYFEESFLEQGYQFAGDPVPMVKLGIGL